MLFDLDPFEDADKLSGKESQAIIQVLLTLHRMNKVRLRLCVFCCCVCAVTAIASVLSALL